MDSIAPRVPLGPKALADPLAPALANLATLALGESGGGITILKTRQPMILEQLLPAKSPTMTEGTIVAWRIQPGDAVKSGQVIAEIQTDKAVIEWEAADNGTVAAILVPAGQVAQVNSIAAIFTSKAGEDAAAAIAAAKDKNTKLNAAAVPAAAATPAVAPAANPLSTPIAAPALAPKAETPTGRGGLRISPLAAKIAAKLGIDVRQVKGSGPEGRIIRRDIEAAAAAGTARIGAGAAGTKPERPALTLTRPDAADTAVAMTPMRKAIARRLSESKAQIPHFYVTDRVDAAALVGLREQLNAFAGVKITVNDLIVRAAALALRQHPEVNATFDGTSIRRTDSADISVAVAIPDGLITPIVFKAHTLTVAQIGTQVRALAKKAAEGRLQPAEFEGGTFTISNLGMFGIESFTAIINPPQAAILAVAGISDEPVVRDGAIVPGKVLRLTLSADHRVVDGAAAAGFLRTLRGLLERPAGLLL